MTPTVQSLVDKAAKYDPSLAAEIREFAQSREYGLVFEHNRPERMRLYGKPVKPGDVVQVLPERGKAESADNKVCWMVESIDDGEASLIMNGRGQADSEHRTASINDLVAVAEYQQPIYAGLKGTGRVENGDPGQPCHVVINGENYHALETLLFAYAGKVDCIYIDPPYNTGAKDWKYNNDYVDGNDAYRHSKWLAMMERRLKLAKQLLNHENSVLICAIDEKEYLRLGLLLEQTFPEASVQMVTTVINPAGAIRVGEFSRVEEHLFFVALGDAHVIPQQSTMLDDVVRKEKGRKVEWIGLRRREPSARRGSPKNPYGFYPIFLDSTTMKVISAGAPLSVETLRSSIPVPDGMIVVWPLTSTNEEGVWGISSETANTYIEKGYIRASVNKNGVTMKYLSKKTVSDIENGAASIVGTNNDGSVIAKYEDAGSVPAKRVWNLKSHNAETYGTLLIKSLIGRRFTYPKSLYAVEDAMRFFIADKPNAVVLDFFAGSGTTAHAVMRLNHQDGGHRQCICVTNNEVSADEENTLIEQGYRHGDPEWERLGICEYVTKPRVKAAITGRTPEGDPVKGDYKFTDEFPMSDGFSENAVFFDLEYLEPDMVELGLAFEQIAPLLWLRAGSKGRMIREVNPAGFELADTYAVLFDYAYTQDFVEQLDAAGDLIRTVFIVTDDDHRYQMMCGRFPDRDVVRLYESYLQSFRIAAEGAEV